MSPAERILVFFFLSALGGNFLNAQAQSTGKTKGQEAKPNVKAEAKPNLKGEAKADVKPSAIAGARYDPAGHQDPFLNLGSLRHRTDEDSVVEAAAVPGIGGMRISEIALV